MASPNAVPKVEFEAIAKTLIETSVSVQKAVDGAMNKLVRIVQEPLSVPGHSQSLRNWEQIESSIDLQIKAIKGKSAKKVLTLFRRAVRNFLRYKTDENANKAFPKTWPVLSASVDKNNRDYKDGKIRSLGIFNPKTGKFSSDEPLTKDERAQKVQDEKDEYRKNNPKSEETEIPPTEDFKVDTASPSVTVLPEVAETKSPSETHGPAYSELVNFLDSQDQETQEFLSLQILEIIKSNSENITIDKVAV